MKKGKKLKKKAARSARQTKTNSRIKALQRRRKKCEEGVTRRGGTRWPHLNHHCTRMASFIRKFKVRSREAVLRSIPFVRSIILYNRRLFFPFESTSVDSGKLKLLTRILARAFYTLIFNYYKNKI